MFYKITIVFLLTAFVLTVFPQRIVSKKLEIYQLPLADQINYFANLYGVDSRLVSKVIECESDGQHEAVGDGGRSRGIGQFQKPTFESLEELYFKEYNEYLDYESEFDQIKLLTWSIANGHGRNWTAYRAIKNGGTYTFYSKQMKRWYTVYCKL